MSSEIMKLVIAAVLSAIVITICWVAIVYLSPVYLFVGGAFLSLTAAFWAIMND